MSPQERYDMRQFDAREAARKLFADRAAGRAQTPRQMRDAQKMAAQQQMRENIFAMQNPEAFASVMNARGNQALAKSQMEATNARVAEDQKIRKYGIDKAADTTRFNAWSQRYNAAIHGGATPDDAALIAGPMPGQETAPGASPAAPSPFAPPANPPTTPPSPFAPPVAGAPSAAPPSPFSPPKQEQPSKQLLGSQIAQIAKLPVEQRETALRGMGVTSAKDLHYYQSKLDPRYDEKLPGYGKGTSPKWVNKVADIWHSIFGEPKPTFVTPSGKRVRIEKGGKMVPVPERPAVPQAQPAFAVPIY